MKILGKAVPTITLLFALSCKTVDIDSISNREYPEVINNVVENELPPIDLELNKVDFKIYSPYRLPEVTNNTTSYKLPVIDFLLPKVTFKIFSRDDIDILKQESDLIPVLFTKPEPEVVPEPKPEENTTFPLNSNNSNNKNDNETPSVVKNSSSTTTTTRVVKPKLIPSNTKNSSETIVEPKVETTSVIKSSREPVKTVPKKVSEPEPDKIYILDDKEVLVSKSFTIDMDQSGWLFKKVINGIDFKNKFYLNDKVLFEFIPQRVGEYTLEFVKYNGSSEEHTRVKINVVSEMKGVNSNNEPTVIIPEKVVDSRSRKKILEDQLEDIRNVSNPDKVYYELAEIYYEEGLLRKAKEYFEYVYDNYPLSIYYREAENKMNYIIDNFLKVR